MKKVGIITLGLKDNYGGILQAICLYSHLKNIGYKPVLIRKYYRETVIRKLIINILEIIPFQNIKGIRLSKKKYINNFEFLSNYIFDRSPIFFTKKEISNYINEEKLDAVIVGSDQVWRYKYINDGEYDTYFLNLDISPEAKKISYAASFGGDTWEAPDLNKDISKFLSKFTAVSVRENTGISICKNQFNYEDAEFVLDPTLLIDVDFYETMIKNIPSQKADCIEYILDKSEFKSSIVSELKTNLNFSKTLELLNSSKIYSIPEWVAAFKNTDFVITDSFHGMVFSIIFNKQFVVFVNESRGSSRFESLCEILNIKGRLIYGQNEYNNTLVDINYEDVNKIIDEMRIKSSDFLKMNIES
ncbi:polysaccharide pyruvyl transferase family protein [Acinetobacter cumulans]|uniref:polysaccharide pyruvyl transferase family protein n=1 Tax=Acinetobacter cumulans TaxID=2136182 RepID=UPI00148E61CE|nr:polysaccharide pyruvyl transferase family protein [Acinetobacter cumulans]